MTAVVRRYARMHVRNTLQTSRLGVSYEDEPIAYCDTLLRLTVFHALHVGSPEGSKGISFARARGAAPGAGSTRPAGAGCHGDSSAVFPVNPFYYPHGIMV